VGQLASKALKNQGIDSIFTFCDRNIINI